MNIQKGKMSTKHIAAVGMLLALLYLVLPGGAPKKGSHAASPHAPADAAATQPVAESPRPDTPAAGGSSPLNEESPELSEAALITLKPLSEVGDSDLEMIISRNPFFTSIAQSSLQKPEPPPLEAADAAATAEAADIKSMVASSKLSLLYSSSRGTKAAILDDEVIYDGSKTSSQMTVQAIRPDGIELVPAKSEAVRTE